MLTWFRIKQLGPPAARWGVAAGSIGFFLLYEELPQLAIADGDYRCLRVLGLSVNPSLTSLPPADICAIRS